MNKRVGIVTAIIFAAVLVSGCFGKAADPDKSTPVGGEVSETRNPVVAGGMQTSVTDVVLDSDYIKNLLLKSTKLEGYSYDLKVAFGTIETNSRAFYSGKKSKVETISPTGETMITVNSGESEVTYQTDTKKGYRHKGNNLNLSPVLKEEDIKRLEFKYVSVENVDGMPCLVVQWEDGAENTKRAWIHEEYGIVIKMHSITQGIATEYTVSNLKLGKVPDIEFIVPYDIEITEIGG